MEWAAAKILAPAGPEDQTGRGGGLEEGRQWKRKEIQRFGRGGSGRSIRGPSGAHAGVILESALHKVSGRAEVSPDAPSQGSLSHAYQWRGTDTWVHNVRGGGGWGGAVLAHVLLMVWSGPDNSLLCICGVPTEGLRGRDRGGTWAGRGRDVGQAHRDWQHRDVGGM